MYSKGTATEDIKQGNPVLFDQKTGDLRRDVVQMCENGAFNSAPAPEPKATIEQDGKRYEWVRYGVTVDGDYVISHSDGTMFRRGGESLTEYNIFRPVPVLHRFGPPGAVVVFEETGEHVPQPG